MYYFLRPVTASASALTLPPAAGLAEEGSVAGEGSAGADQPRNFFSSRYRGQPESLETNSTARFRLEAVDAKCCPYGQLLQVCSDSDLRDDTVAATIPSQ